MNGAELYSLGRKLTGIAGDALPAESVLRRISPGARLVLEDAVRHPGTSAGETAARTGLLSTQVSALAQEMAADGFIDISAGPAGDQVSVGRALLFRGDTTAPVDAALAAALGTADAAEVAGLLETLARRLGAGTALRAPGDFSPGFFDAAYRGTPAWEIGHPQRAPSAAGSSTWAAGPASTPCWRRASA